jgi:chemotaxis protein histidine kinase CheA
MSFTQYLAGLDITPGRAYAPFWSAFIHVVRDTMDHEARQARGQSTQSTIRVSTRATDDQFIVMIEDDGPGSDWQAGEPSGRDLRMVAARNACEALGGSVEIAQRKGEGIRISFAFPKQATTYEGHSAVLPRVARQGTSAA